MSEKTIRLTPSEEQRFDKVEFEQMNSERFGGKLVFEQEEQGAVIHLPSDMGVKDHNDAQLLIEGLHGARGMG